MMVFPQGHYRTFYILGNPRGEDTKTTDSHQSSSEAKKSVMILVEEYSVLIGYGMHQLQFSTNFLPYYKGCSIQ